MDINSVLHSPAIVVLAHSRVIFAKPLPNGVRFDPKFSLVVFITFQGVMIQG